MNVEENTSLAARLASVQVGLREDLEITRHLFRNAPSYIVRDPLTFQSQRLQPADYQILVTIDAGRPLCEIFHNLVEREKLTADDEEHFYRFIMNLHRLGFLRLPISDDKSLYRRYEARARARKKQRLLSVLFLRVPLWNPNAFLDRTIERVRPLFGRNAFVLWALLMGTAGVVALGHWDELFQPLQGLLVARNVVIMWITLIGLKVIHEFGHAFACKHFGGVVPEMGAYFILFTPCAYMDATASWGFTRKRDRIIVCLAGMYVESFVAALALFVWALTDPSLLHSLAYNVMFLAGVVTLLFNINPLMRYDGYYVLSDLVEVPNLRARSTEYVLNVLKKLVLRIPSKSDVRGWRLRLVLFGYGVSASVYRVGLLLAIAGLLATKMFLVGLLLAMVFLGSTLASTFRRLVCYLWQAEETAGVRRRAVVVSVFLFILVPATLGLVPLPYHVHARGVVTTEHEFVARAASAGTLERIHITGGQVLQEGALLADLSDDLSLEEHAVARSNLQAARIRRDAYRIAEPYRASQEEHRLRVYRLALEQAEMKLASSHVHTPVAGRVVECLEHDDVGRFLAKGAPLATLASGRWRVRSFLTSEELFSTQPRIGAAVEFRAASGPADSIAGMIVRISPVGSTAITLSPLTHLGGGSIPVDPVTLEAEEPYFEVTIELSNESAPHLRYGMTGFVRFQAEAEPVATRMFRRLARFINKLMQE